MRDEPVDARTAALFTSGQIRYSGMQIIDYGQPSDNLPSLKLQPSWG